MQTLNFPKMGQGMEEGTVVEWLVDEGESVSEGDPVVEIESEKTVTEIAAKEDGVLLEQLVNAGSTVPVGTELGYIGDNDEQSGTVSSADTAVDTSDSSPSPETDGQMAARERDVNADSGDKATQPSEGRTAQPSDNDITDPPSHVRATPTARRRAREFDVEIDSVAAARGVNQVTPQDVELFANGTQSDSTADDAVAHESVILGSPWARVVAEDHGVTIEEVGANVGTNRVRAADVQEYVANRTEPSGTTADADIESTIEGANESSTGPSVQTEEQLTGASAKMFERMSEVTSDYASTTTIARVDVTELYDLYKQLANAWSGGDAEALSITAFVVRAVAQTLPEYGPLNAEIVDDEALRIYDDVNVGIAVDTDSGLLVPTIYNADERSVRDLSNEIDRLANAAQSRSLDYDEMQNGTFTLSNAGSLGAYINTPQINPPQTAILGMCKIFEEPAVVDGDIVPRRMMHLTLTYDHRVVEGATAVEFLQDVKSKLERPESLLS